MLVVKNLQQYWYAQYCSCRLQESTLGHDNVDTYISIARSDRILVMHLNSYFLNMLVMLYMLSLIKGNCSRLETSEMFSLLLYYDLKSRVEY